MNMREAFQQAKRLWPSLKPTRPAMNTLTDDKRGVIIACHDQPVSLVIYSETDLYRIRAMIEIALSNHK